MSFAPFAGKKYLNLETFKKNGTGVKTPVWFAEHPTASLDSNDAKLYVYTIGVSGKVKRIRNNPRVRIAPCDMRGKVLGEWVEARAEIVTGEEDARGTQLLKKNIFLGNSCWISLPGSATAITRYLCSVLRERSFTAARASQMCPQSANCRSTHQKLL